jgi:TRAP-type transport system small permease protein
VALSADPPGMDQYSRLCAFIHRILVWVSLFGLVLIVVNLTLQVFSRYLFDAPIHSTDEIAQNTLTWLAFLGAAFVYRERGHIEIDFFVVRMPKRVSTVIATVMELLVLGVMLLLIKQIFDMADTMSRVVYGTLIISKFTLQFVPALISAVCTILFVIEHIARIWRGAPEQRAPGFHL